METADVKGILKIPINAEALWIPYMNVDKNEKKTLLDLNKRKICRPLCQFSLEKTVVFSEEQDVSEMFA